MREKGCTFHLAVLSNKRSTLSNLSKSLSSSKALEIALTKLLSSVALWKQPLAFESNTSCFQIEPLLISVVLLPNIQRQCL